MAAHEHPHEREDYEEEEAPICRRCGEPMVINPAYADFIGGTMIGSTPAQPLVPPVQWICPNCPDNPDAVRDEENPDETEHKY